MPSIGYRDSALYLPGYPFQVKRMVFCISGRHGLFSLQDSTHSCVAITHAFATSESDPSAPLEYSKPPVSRSLRLSRDHAHPLYSKLSTQRHQRLRDPLLYPPFVLLCIATIAIEHTRDKQSDIHSRTRAVRLSAIHIARCAPKLTLHPLHRANRPRRTGRREQLHPALARIPLPPLTSRATTAE
jgi:hypothetical protein